MNPRLVCEIEVPGVPVPWARPDQGRNGRRFTNPRDKAHRELVALLGARAMQGKPLIEGHVMVHVYAMFPVPASASKAKREAMTCTGNIRPGDVGDVDNIAKGVHDALEGVCYRNDAQIVEAYQRKLYAVDARTEIRVYALDAAT